MGVDTKSGSIFAPSIDRSKIPTLIQLMPAIPKPSRTTRSGGLLREDEAYNQRLDRLQK